DERPAHVVDFVHEVRVQRKGAAVVVDAVNTVVVRLLGALAREDVDFVLPPLQGCGQFRDVHAHTAYRDRMQSLPRKQCNSHALNLRCASGLALNLPARLRFAPGANDASYSPGARQLPHSQQGAFRRRLSREAGGAMPPTAGKSLLKTRGAPSNVTAGAPGS